MKGNKKGYVFLQLMIVFDEEKRILRYCLFIEDRIWIVYQMHRQGFSGGGEEGWRAKNLKKGVIMSFMNEFT